MKKEGMPLRNTLVLGILLLILAGLSLEFLAQDQPKDPSWVDSEMWVPIANNFGIALSEYGSIVVPHGKGKPTFRELLRSHQEIRGTLMVKVDGVWHPLYLTPPPVGFQPAN
jgi:hypothetical protein